MTNNVPSVIEQKEERSLSVFSTAGSFETAQRMAKALASSALVPTQFQGEKGFPNCLIALEVAQRTGSSIMAVTQNLNIIHGKPSWSSNYIIGAINASGRFKTKLKFKFDDRGAKKVSGVDIRDKSCVAYATDQDGDLITGPEVTVEMAVKEGWYTKNGSKWPTMTDLMLSYRAAAFFGRLYTPEILLGMQTEDEARDVTPTNDPAPTTTAKETVNNLNEKIKKTKAEKKTAKPVDNPVETVENTAPVPEQVTAEIISEVVEPDQAPSGEEFF